MEKNVKVDEQSLKSIANDIIELVIKKNSDYGDAWQRYGEFTSLIRLNDKLLRVENLAGGKQALVADEDIKQTMKDIVGYGLLCMLRLEWEEVNKTRIPLQMPLPVTQGEAVIQHIATNTNYTKVYRDEVVVIGEDFRWRVDENGDEYIYVKNFSGRD